jgi:Tol biopolymer transport system component
MNADGSEQRILTRNKAKDIYAAWSPDGKRLAFISNRDGGEDVYVMDVK